MSDQARIDELLDQWEDAWEQRCPLSAAELCTEYPELTETVATRIRALKATSWLNETKGEEDDFLSLPRQLTKDSFTVPASLSLEELARNIAASGLLTAEQLQLVDGTTANDLAETLISNRQLTAYQVEQICAGNTSKLVLGNYVILDVIGAGGMGEVFKARHTRMKRVVALKILPEKAVGSPMAVERFHREVEAAARLTHPNIVVAHDADEYEGTHFLVMEFVAGTDFASLVKQRGRLPIGQAVDCIIQAARGLEYAHGEGVVHRDIKPANLLLDSKGKVKILDMGLARFEEAEGADGFAATQAELTAEGTVLGTIDYLAPEQALDTRRADARADIYSLGCTFYFLLTGLPLYSGNTLMAKMLAHREQEIPSMRDHRADVPDELATIFAKMVAKQPEDRYPSMSALLADLEALAAKYATTWQPESSDAAIANDEQTLADSPAHDTSTAGIADTLKFTSQPKSTTQPLRASRNGRRWLLAIAGVAALLLGVILIQTPDGTIRIETNQTNVEVLVDGKQVVYITDPQDKTKISVKIPNGAKMLRVRKAGFEADVKEFKLNTVKGLVKVSFVPVTEPRVGGDVDREVAEWVLRIGGRITSDRENRPLTDVGELPNDKFKVVSVNLSKKRLTNEDLEHFKNLTSLTNLNLQSTLVGNAGLKHLKDLPKLTDLTLNQTSVSGAGLQELQKLTNLTRLHISGTRVSDGDLRHLRELTKLTTLHLTRTQVGDAGLEHLKEMGNLTLLHLESTQVSDAGIEHLKRLTKLATLDLRGTKVTAQGIAALQKALPKCAIAWDGSAIWIPNDSQQQFLDAVARLPAADQVTAVRKKLQELNPGFDGNVTQQIKAGDVVGFSFVSDDVAEIWPVRGLSKLSSLGCAAVHPRRGKLADISPLSGLPLRRLELKGFALRDLSPLRGMPLSEFKCEAPNVTDLSPLQGMSLKVLEIPYTSVADLSPLANMPLRQLAISFTRIVDLSPLKGMALESFSCAHIRVDDIAPLKGMPLVQLSLHNTAVTDAALPHLKGLTKLETLNLEFSKVTAQGAAALQKALPNCKITWDGNTSPDRKAAEWVLSKGGSIATAAGEITEVAKLPAGPFQVVVVDLFNIRQVTDDDLNHLKALAKLSDLVLAGTQISDKGLLHLKSVTSLTALGLSRTKISNSGTVHLKQLSNLHLLGLSGTQIGDSGLRHLKELKKLKTLALEGCPLTDAGLEHLKGMRYLTILGLSDTPTTDKGLQHLARLKALRTLTLKKTKVTAQGVAEFQKAVPDCKIFWDGDTNSNRKAAEWVLSIGGSISNAAGKFTEVAKLPTEPFQIDVVDLYGQRQLTDNDLANIKGLTKISHLNLMHSQVTDNGLEHLKGMTELLQLNIGYARLKGPGLAHLKDLTKLQSLNLHGTQVDDTSLKHLKGLTDLTHLELARTRVSDAGLQSLTGLTKLKTLTLGETQVSDQGLQHLEGFTNLRMLDLSRTTVTDEGLKQLTALKTLMTLRLSKTKVTSAGIAEFQKARPKCKIE